MCYTQSFVQPLVNSVIRLETDRLVPDLTEIYRYYLYTLEKDLRAKGTVLVVKSAVSEYFVLEMCPTYEYDGCPRLYINVRTFEGDVNTLFYRGRVWDTGINLVYKAVNLVDRLSFFFRYLNNSKTFVEKFLTLTGVGFHRYVQDFERVLLMVYGYSAAELFRKSYEETHTNRSRGLVMESQITTKECAYF
ncbi:hypothetical protein ACJMK2_002569 [Sinanodonta woodiana]|uniref:Uncharacterized protein n=1 Tax=Sinanodonta woodiana TaxID=1069815 RepID=A0ABD3XXX5_SINWO